MLATAVASRDAKSSGSFRALLKRKYGGPERRQRHRVTNEVKILVNFKDSYQSSEVGSVKNLTRNGIFFEAFGNYQPGMGIGVMFPYDPSKASMERPIHADVVRVQKIKDSMKKGVAIKLLGIFLKP